MKAKNFNNEWTFYKEGEMDQSIIVNIPHDAQLGEKREASLPSDSGYFPGGKYIYTKKYKCPKDVKTVILEFDGVYMLAYVYINGQEVCFQPGGYTNFVVPIHEYLDVDKENEIMVIADNSLFPNARWYTGAGIYRNVVIYEGNEKHLSVHGTKITTLDYKKGIISVNIDDTYAKGCNVKTDILYDGKIIASKEGFSFELEIPNVKLWDEDNPNLYEAHILLFDQDKLVDETSEKFGVRHIEWDASFGMKINGNVVLLRGGCVHHDNGILGSKAYRDTEYRKVRLLKEAGYNAIRSSHNMCSKVMLEACDEYGVYMMDEFTDMWTQHKQKHDYATYFKDWYEKDLTALVNRDYNHPSMIMYSIGNEVGESATPEGIEYAKKMTDLLHSLDKTRPVTCGINLLLNGLTAMGKGLYQEDGMSVNKDNNEKKESGSTFINIVMSKMGAVLNFVGRLKQFDLATKDVFGILNIAGYNYGSGRYKDDPKKYPNRVTIGSETFPPRFYKNWQDVKRYPNLIGDFMWTAWDYLGEAGIGTAGYGDNGGILKSYPNLLAGPGIIEITGEFRPEVYWNKSIWGINDKPYISVEPLTHADEKVSWGMWRETDGRHSWSWSGCEGKSTTVLVYCDADKVELYVNGSKTHTSRVKENKAIFKNVKYIPGELKAIAYKNSSMIGEDILISAGKPTCLSIDIEKENKSSELVYANIYVCDDNGERVYSHDVAVDIEVKCGTLLGFGSANPTSEEGYLSTSHTTYYGHVQAIILKDKESKVEIKVNAKDLRGCKI